ncbi:unnamed protein product [Angiostrongylus costaricensis]|uniref:Reverse transcriptase n=1 Tax=Angiostrongylus costaricensis TaxID=334426 RepID=A0A0R3PXB0_ANGCS|nr:unnamed protein product [Angiostrongylus costaricensis]
MLGVSRFTQVREGIRSSDLCERSKIKDAVLYARQSKIRWAGHAMRLNDNRWTRAVSDWIPRDVKHTAGRPPTRWSEFFTKNLEERYDVRRVPRASRTHWAILACDKEKMEDLLAPVRVTRRSPGLQVIQVTAISYSERVRCLQAIMLI